MSILCDRNVQSKLLVSKKINQIHKVLHHKIADNFFVRNLTPQISGGK
jgi:hypothetical protein